MAYYNKSMNKSGYVKNLKSNSERTPKEWKELAKKAGIKSGEVRRAKKAMCEMLDYLFEKEVTNEQGEQITVREEITAALIKKAMQGDVRAFEIIRDTIGEKPTEQHNITTLPPPIIIDNIPQKG